MKANEFADIAIAHGNIKYFYKLLKSAENTSIPGVLIHGHKGGKSNNRKVNKTVKNIIIYFGRNGNKSTVRSITNQTNTMIRALPSLNGGKTISQSVVGEIIRDPENNNFINIYRSSPNFLNDHILPYLSLINAKYPCDSFQIDGTKIQFACKDNQNNILSQTIIYVLDSFSKRILGYAVGDNENSDLVKEAFEMAVYACGNKLPTEITTDGASSFKKEMTKIKDYTTQAFGVKWITSSNPRRKSAVERLIRTIQTVFLSPSFGYIGAGIKSKNEAERPNGDVLLLLRDPSYLKNTNRIKDMMVDVIHKYNTIPIYENDYSSLELFNSKKAKNATELLFWQSPYIFWEKHSLKVKNSTVTLYDNKREYIYKSYSEDLVLKINRTTIDCYFKNSADKQVFVFKKDTDQFLGTMELFTRTHGVVVNQSSQDKKRINNHFKDRKLLEEALIGKVKAVEHDLADKLGALPSELINFRIDDKEYMAKAEVFDILGIERKSSEPKEVNLYDTPSEVLRNKKERQRRKKTIQLPNSSVSKVKGSSKIIES